MSGLYIHVPFCAAKCRYCDFYSLPLASKNRVGPQSYLDALDHELQMLPDTFQPTTIFVGGGTPTALPADTLSELLAMIRRWIDLTHATEWSCEANPGTVTPDIARILYDGGVNRVSLGVQSFDNGNLDLLGRIHSGEEARGTFQLLRDTGFSNLNIDLMFAIPEATQRMLETDLNTVMQLAPEHISTYALLFAPGTKLTELRELGKLDEVSDDRQADQYAMIRRRLAEAGYQHYEISNFAKPGFECRHNLLYWGPGEYIGCGPAAHSHWNGARYGNRGDLAVYCERLGKNQPAHTGEERLAPDAKAREALVMGLRRIRGIDTKAFRRDTGYDVGELCGDQIQPLLDRGLLIQDDHHLRLADEALFISNSVFSELV